MSEESGILSLHNRDQDLIRAARLQVEVFSRSTRRAQNPDGTPELNWTIPGYSILHEIHRGGQGAVFQAHQESTGRQVAIKVLREDALASPQERLRFEREAQILGQIDHPGVVRIIDRGCVGNRQWLAMDLVRGRPLSWFFLDREELDDLPARHRSEQIAQRLRLFAAVCDAVHAAHLHGVIHRDLKPGNVLVDDSGQPRVLDFGLAKVAASLSLQRGSTEHAEVINTFTGCFVGSLPWASPEQVGHCDASIDLRSDVYSLGVLLHQMLTDTFPYSVSGSLREVTENITSVVPQRPSTLNPHLNQDLDTIVLRSLAKDAERRYQSAGTFAQDLRQYLAGGPIEARRDSATYLLRKAMRRYRVQFTAVAALFITLIISAVVAWTLYRREQIASANARDAQQQVTERLHESLILQARASRQSGLRNCRQTSLDAVARAAKIDPTLEVRNEAVAAMAVFELKPLPVRMPDRAIAAVDPDGRTCATVVNLNSFEIRRVDDGTIVASIPAPFDGSIDVDSLHRIQLSSNYFARAYDRRSGGRCLEVWRIPQSDLWIEIDDLPDRSSFNISADEKWLAVPHMDRTIRLVDLESRQEVRRIELDSVAGYVKFDPTGRWLAQFHGADHATVVHDLQTGETRRILNGADTQWSLDWSADGSLIAAVDESLIRLWDPVNAQTVGELNGHSDQIVFLKFSPDASMLTSYSWDGQSMIWDVKRREPLAKLAAAIVAWPAASNRLVGSTNRGLCEYEIARNREYVAMVGRDDSDGWSAWPHIAFDPAGRFVVVVSDSQLSLRIFEHPSGKELAAIAAGPIMDVAVDRAGRTLITTGGKGLQVWPVREVNGTLTIGPPRSCEKPPLGVNVDISGDGRFAVAMTDSSETSLGIVDLGSHKLIRTVPVVPNTVCPRFSPDGRWLAVGNWNGDGNAVIFDTSTWEVTRTLVTTLSTTVQFSNDNHYLVSSDTKEIAIWRTNDWTKLASAAASLQRCMMFSPDGRTLAAIPIGGDVRLLDAHSLKELTVLEAPDGSRPRYLAFSPDGETLVVSTSNSRLVQKWNLPLIRSHLRSMDLDWDAPSMPSHESIANIQPMLIHVELGLPHDPH